MNDDATMQLLMLKGLISDLLPPQRERVERLAGEFRALIEREEKADTDANEVRVAYALVGAEWAAQP